MKKQNNKFIFAAFALVTAATAFITYEVTKVLMLDDLDVELDDIDDDFDEDFFEEDDLDDELDDSE